jgi:hypothetical protein
VKCLRLHHMSPAFLISVVSFSDYRDEWPGLAGLCNHALMYQSLGASLSPLLPFSDHLTSCEPRRSPAAFEYELEAKVQLAECSDIDQRQDRTFATRLGFAEGYLIKMDVTKQEKAGGQATVAIHLGLRRPNTTSEQYDTGDTVPFTGPIVRWQVDVNGKTITDFRSLYGGTFRLIVFTDFFKKPWDEVVREGSDYFPQGRMTVKAKARFISDRHVSGP